MFFKKSTEEIRDSILNRLSENTAIKNIAPGSNVHALASIVASELFELYDSFDFNHSMSFLSKANGFFLDLIGELFGVSRLLETEAEVSEFDNNLKFFVINGSLIDKIPSGIPVGTTISNPDGTITYSTIDSVIIDQNQSEVFVSARANGSGSGFNVGPNTLTVHDLGVPDVFVTNQNSINTGRDVESDTNFRFRISQAPIANESSNTTSVRQASLVVPGISDVIVNEFKNGVGTFEVMAIPIGNDVDQGVIVNLRDAMNSIRAFGTRAFVVSPDFVPVEIAVSLKFSDDFIASESQSIRDAVQSAILSYIGSIRMGGLFVVNELIQRVMDMNESILDMEILCYKFRKREEPVRNIRLLDDELFTPDNDVEDPIRVL